MYVSDICHQWLNQNTQHAKNIYPHLRNLELADENKNETSEIDMLIGSEFYWQIMKY